MIEKGIEPPHNIGAEIGPRLLKWLISLWSNYPRMRMAKVTFDPASVGASSESIQTVTVTGLTTNDLVAINKPTNTAGLDIVGCWVSAADTLSIKFRNTTGGAIDAGSEDYLVFSVRL